MGPRTHSVAPPPRFASQPLHWLSVASISHKTAVLGAPGPVESWALLGPAGLELTVCGTDTHGRKSNSALVGKQEKGWMRFTGGSGHRKGVRPEAGKSGRGP